jgi:hypothetical protein
MIAQTSGSKRRNFYLLLLALILLVTVMDYQQEKSGADILRHVMLCPVYLLAGHGIAALFPPVDRASSSWWIDMERHILDGLSLAIFPVVVILDHPGNPSGATADLTPVHAALRFRAMRDVVGEAPTFDQVITATLPRCHRASP